MGQSLLRGERLAVVIGATEQVDGLTACNAHGRARSNNGVMKHERECSMALYGAEGSLNLNLVHSGDDSCSMSPGTANCTYGIRCIP